MVENKEDTLARAYAMLKSLRENIGQMTKNSIPETYVREFHAVLDRLAGIGIEVAEYRIPDLEIAPRVTAIHTLTFADSPKGGADYSEEKYVDKSFILTQLDAILGYFEIITSEKPRTIGFHKPDSE